jgi:FlgD Ig-like domain
MRQALAFLFLVARICFLPQHAQAQWQVDGIGISTATGNQGLPRIVADGAGGMIATWQDFRGGVSYDIYVQRVNGLGVPLWTPDGVALCTAVNEQSHPTIVPDGFGGAIVTWHDYRSGNIDIYAQRVNAAGIPQWTTDGVALCTAANDQNYPTIAPDMASGAIVTWEDSRSELDIYAQHVNASGVPLWTANGVALCTATSGQRFPTIDSDGAGGAIITWRDHRTSAYSDIYAQRVNVSGIPQWTVNGIALCTAAYQQIEPVIVSDGTGGAIVTWTDYRSGDDTSDIYTQRVNALGVPQWTIDGVALSTAISYQQIPVIVSDGTGSAIVTWTDFRNGAGDIYAQRVNASGIPQWTADGAALCTDAHGQFSPVIASDPAGGAIVAWTDFRNGTDYGIYAQRVSTAGVPQWTTDGIAVCAAANTQDFSTIISDGGGGAFVAWEDSRNGLDNSDIYAQHVTNALNAVAIASFDASETGGVVTLRSAFRSDLGVTAVNVYRAAGTDPLLVLERVNDVRGDRFVYVDRDVAPSRSYRYQIGVIDRDGEFFSPIASVSVRAIGVTLSQNQPNPFNPTTTIHFVLPVREDVTLVIYDANGHLVRTLVNDVEGYGAHDVTWDGRDDNGAVMGSGVYFYRLRAGKITESKKMVLLK